MLKAVAGRLDGYGSMADVEEALKSAPRSTTDEYAQDQIANNVRVTRDYLEPLIRRTSSRTVLDVGCGVGTSVATLVEDGYDAYGVDLAPLTRHWAENGIEKGRFFVVVPAPLDLPFEDGALDFVYSFGAIEHVGTVDGHATRRDDYHECRRQWLRELFRAVRPGGHLLVGGPNRRFPLDFSHGLDSRSSALERLLSRAAGVSVHRTWGDYFLWGYGDIPRYLEGLNFQMNALSIQGLLKFGRVPRRLRSFAGLYVEKLPRPALSTAFNPWVMALIRRGSSEQSSQERGRKR